MAPRYLESELASFTSKMTEMRWAMVSSLLHARSCQVDIPLPTDCVETAAGLLLKPCKKRQLWEYTGNSRNQETRQRRKAMKAMEGKAKCDE